MVYLIIRSLNFSIFWLFLLLSLMSLVYFWCVAAFVNQLTYFNAIHAYAHFTHSTRGWRKGDVYILEFFVIVYFLSHGWIIYIEENTFHYESNSFSVLQTANKKNYNNILFSSFPTFLLKTNCRRICWSYRC